MAGLWKVCFFGEGDKDLKVATLIHRLELKVGSNTIRHYGQGCSRSRYPWASNVELHYNQCTGASSDFCTQEWHSGGRSSRSPTGWCRRTKEKEKAKRIFKGNEKCREWWSKGQSNFCHNCGKTGRLDIDCSSPRKQQVDWLLIAPHPSSSRGEKFMEKYNLHQRE